MMLDDLRVALEEGQLFLQYQPVVSIKTGHVSEVTVDENWFLREIAARPDEITEQRRKTNEAMGLPTLTSDEARERLVHG